MSKKAIINHLKCKGCYYCIDVCPKQSIKKTGLSNPKGYDYVKIDNQTCIGCGACLVICPDCCIEIIEDTDKNDNAKSR